MRHVPQRLVEHCADVWVVEVVDDLSALPSADDETEVAEDPELVRYRRLRHLHRTGDLARGVGWGGLPLLFAPATRCRQGAHHPCHLSSVLDADVGAPGDPMGRTDADMLACTSRHIKVGRGSSCHDTAAVARTLRLGGAG